MGHVNNSVYLSYFEYARVYYFNQLLGNDWDWEKHSVLVVKNEVVYIRPVHIQDEPTVEILLESIGTKSFTLAYNVYVKNDVVTTGKSTLVCFDISKQQTVEVSESWKKALLNLKEFVVE